jgi:hypothetical protein
LVLSWLNLFFHPCMASNVPSIYIININKIEK